MDSLTTVIIPFDFRVGFVRSLNRAEFPSRLSKIAQAFDAVSGSQFLAPDGGPGEWWSLGTL